MKYDECYKECKQTECRFCQIHWDHINEPDNRRAVRRKSMLNECVLSVMLGGEKWYTVGWCTMLVLTSNRESAYIYNVPRDIDRLLSDQEKTGGTIENYQEVER